MNKSNTLQQSVIAGLLAGVLGGLVYAALSGLRVLPLTGNLERLSFPGSELAIHVLISAMIGIGFGAVFRNLAVTSGSGLMWGVAYGLLWWVAGQLAIVPLLVGRRPVWTVEATRPAFPHLLGHLVGYGAVLGLAYVLLSPVLSGGWQREQARQIARDSVLAVFIGGLAGLVGGLAFGAWMARVGFFPLVAGLIRSDSASVGRLLHFIISIIIGASYGVLFRRDIRGIGSSTAWGMAYGLIWWILGPLTIMPWWLGRGVQWSLAAGQAAFPSLVGHVIYGILLGVVYSMVDRLWRVLFTESDPLKREPEGPGARSLRAVGMGVLASVAGGLAFTVVMIKTDALPLVASLVGLSSALAGFVTHMVISAIIGATYGLLFRREAYTYGAGLAWGLVYGLAWWFLGPLTLMPILLGMGPQWSLASALGDYPSLIGHLAYGATTALVYQLLVRRYEPGPRAGTRRRQARLRRTPGTPAPALWVFVLLIGVMLPLIFAGSV